jgi:short-subunit dehydrogenase
MARPVPTTVPVVVTGASSGIGEEFARRFAERGHPVTVVARRVERLEVLAQSLRDRFGVELEVIGADLETTRGRSSIVRAIRRLGAIVLVNNAGFGTRGRSTDLDPARERAEVQVDVVTPHELTLAALPAMVAAGTGGVINLGSTAAFQPLPFMSTYAACKAFVLHYSEALAEELRGTGVRVMALCPGPVPTEFGHVAGVQDYMRLARPMQVSVERCVAAALRAFDRGHAVCVPGALNATLALGPKLAPRALVRRVAKPIFAPR